MAAPVLRRNLFISYTQEDGDVAASLASQLDDAGFSCFMADRSILIARQWEPAIKAALSEADAVLVLITPRSKQSLWVAAEAGAAWILEKPLIPVLMFVAPEELFEPLRHYQARLAETPKQMAALVEELRTIGLREPHRVRMPPPVWPVEDFLGSSWERLLKVGEWDRHRATNGILGGGVHRYLLSTRTYGPEPFAVQCRLKFLELHPINEVIAVNAGIVFGWRVLEGARQYHHLMFTGSRVVLERIGSRGGDEFDYHHLDDGVPFVLEVDRVYELVIHMTPETLEVRCGGSPLYAVRLPEQVPPGRIGLRPWRSRVLCERFEASRDERT
jgi:hypothetical protein